jgi:hypothetical protein
MRYIYKHQHLNLTCEDGWLQLECAFPLVPLRRGLVVTVLAAITVWGGPELVQFVQLIVGAN